MQGWGRNALNPGFSVFGSYRASQPLLLAWVCHLVRHFHALVPLRRAGLCRISASLRLGALGLLKAQAKLDRRVHKRALRAMKGM